MFSKFRPDLNLLELCFRNWPNITKFVKLANQWMIFLAYAHGRSVKLNNSNWGFSRSLRSDHPDRFGGGCKISKGVLEKFKILLFIIRNSFTLSNTTSKRLTPKPDLRTCYRFLTRSRPKFLLFHLGIQYERHNGSLIFCKQKFSLHLIYTPIYMEGRKIF